MSYIFNRGVLLKELEKHNIKAELDTQEHIDHALVELAQQICNSDNFLGAGIDRSAFYCSNKTVLKVSKQYYVDYEDNVAREDYYDDYGYDEEDSEYGWEFNNLDLVETSTEKTHQSEVEIKNFIQASLLDKIKDHIFKIYAATTNGAVMLVERCAIGDYDYNKIAEAGEAFSQVYEDVHENNLGINSKNNIVLIDLGFEEDWYKICEHYNVTPRIIKFKSNWNKRRKPLFLILGKNYVIIIIIGKGAFYEYLFSGRYFYNRR